MACSEFPGAYGTYKANTNIFVAWLSQAAEDCGWKPSARGAEIAEESRTANSHSQTGHHPSPGDCYTVSTRDILNQIDLVAESKRDVKVMPVNVCDALKTSIELRERFVAWYERLDPESEESTSRHRYFVQVLRRAIHRLSALGEDTEQEAGQSNTDITAINEEDFKISRYENFWCHSTLIFVVFKANFAPRLSNIYDALQLEDVTEGDTPGEVSSKSAPQIFQADRHSQLQNDCRMEMAFIVFSFFEDLARLRTKLMDIWSRVRRGELHLVQATVQTAMCLEFARQGERKAYEAYTSVNPATEHTYRDLCTVISAKFSPDQDEEEPNTQASSSTSEKSPITSEFIFRQTGVVLSRLGKMLEKGTVAVEACCPDWETFSTDSSVEESEKKDTFIIHMFLDMLTERRIRNTLSCVVDYSRYSLREMALPYEEPLLATLHPVWTEGNITTTMVFAFQIMWDIHTVCGKGLSTIDILNSAAQKYEDSFKFSNVATGQLTLEGFNSVGKPGLVLKLLRCVRYHLRNYYFPHFKSFMYLNSIGVPDEVVCEVVNLPVKALCSPNPLPPIKQPPPHPKPDTDTEGLSGDTKGDGHTPMSIGDAFLVKFNPLHTGTLLMDAASMAEEVGITLANREPTIFMVAHIYNALRKLEVCQKEWPEMERIINLQNGPIFANNIPTTPKDMWARFKYRMGMSDNPKNRLRIKDMTWRFTAHRATQPLLQFFTGKETLPGLLATLAAQAEEAIPNEKISRGLPRGKGKRHGPKRHTPENTLSKLEKYTGAVFAAIETDYVGMTRKCTRLLRRINTTLLAELKNPYLGVTPVSDAIEELFPVALVMLKEARIHEEVAVARNKGKNEPVDIPSVMKGAERLNIAKRCFEEEIFANL